MTCQVKQLAHLTLLLAVGCLCLPAWATDFHVAKTGDDTTGDGSIGNPLLTIQKGVDTATSAGDRVIVHAGTYTERGCVTGNFCGITTVASGALGNPITIMAAPGEPVVIDPDNGPILNSLGQPDIVASIVGFSVRHDDIVIDGFEIKNAVAGVATDGASINSGLPADHPERLVVRNCHIHDITGGTGSAEPPDAFANPVPPLHAAVTDNVGALKLDGCWDCEVHDNVLHNVAVVKERGDPDGSGAAGPLRGVKQLECRTPTHLGLACDPATVTAGGNQNTAGIHAFALWQPDIHNNVMFNAHTGVFQKRAPPIDVDLVPNGDSGSISKNRIYDTQFGVRYSVSGNCDFQHDSARVFENIFYNLNDPKPMEIGVFTDAFNARESSRLLVVYNNTFASRHGVEVDSFSNTRVFNNIFDSTTSATGRPITLRESDAGIVDCTAAPIPDGPPHGPFPPALPLSDRNLVWDGDDAVNRGGNFAIDPAGAPQVNFGTLANWQSNTPATPVLCAPLCDAASVEADPLFAATTTTGTPVNGQLFTLTAGSLGTALGRAIDGTDSPAGAAVDAGAYPNGAFDPVDNPGGDIVGSGTTPLPPTGLSGTGG